MRITSRDPYAASAVRRIVCVLAAGTIGTAVVAAQRPGGSATAKAPVQTPAKSAPSTPASPPPQVFVTGIQVVGTGLGANGAELHAFNERPGMSVALGIVAPAGSGIVEIDSRASRVDAFTDDKGQSLLEEGRFGPFPKLSDDRSAALVDIEVRGRPSAGASAISLQGAVGVTMASGSKPTRISNVKFEPSRTMKLGSATITVKSVNVADESTEIGLGLSRQVLNTISTVRFFDAKGEVIESRRTSSGYMNDAAEVEYRVSGKQLPVAVEFEIWQNMRQVKVPFSLTAGLSFGENRPAAATPAPTPSAAPGPSASSTPAAPKLMPGPNDGAASVDAVVSQMQSAATSGKPRALLALVYPDDRTTYAQAVAVALAFSLMGNTADPKVADKAQKNIDALYAKHKLKMPLSNEPDVIFKDTDLGAFVTDAMTYLKTQMKGIEGAEALPVPKGKPEDTKIDGDSAVAKLGDKDVKFARLNNKWFIRMIP
jgi:hypothetical protein